MVVVVVVDFVWEEEEKDIHLRTVVFIQLLPGGGYAERGYSREGGVDVVRGGVRFGAIAAGAGLFRADCCWGCCRLQEGL